MTHAPAGPPTPVSAYRLESVATARQKAVFVIMQFLFLAALLWLSATIITIFLSQFMTATAVRIVFVTYGTFAIAWQITYIYRILGMKRAVLVDATPPAGLRIAMATTIVPSREFELLREKLEGMAQVDPCGNVIDHWVLDEENDPRVRAMIAEFNQRYGYRGGRFLHFSRKGVARFNEAPSGRHFKCFQARQKGGNINAWLDATRSEGYDLITFLDLDHVPKAGFYRNVLPYFKDGDVSFVQGPESFRNREQNFVTRAASLERDTFYGLIHRSYFGLGMPVIVGAHTTFRAGIFHDLGGFYPVHLTEDYLIMLRLRALGKRGVFIDEVLAVGELPSTWTAYIGQQLRWASGGLDLLLRYFPSVWRSYTGKERLFTFMLLNYYVWGAFFMLSKLALFFLLLGGLTVRLELPLIAAIGAFTAVAMIGNHWWERQFFIERGRRSFLLESAVMNNFLGGLYFLSLLGHGGAEHVLSRDGEERRADVRGFSDALVSARCRRLPHARNRRPFPRLDVGAPDGRIAARLQHSCVSARPFGGRQPGGTRRFAKTRTTCNERHTVTGPLDRQRRNRPRARGICSRITKEDFLKTTVRFAVMAFVVGVVTLPSHAATILVAPSEVLLSPGNGKCSLREAMLNAEGAADFSGNDCAAGSAGDDTISLAANSIYVLPDRDPYPLEVLLNDRETNGLPELHTQFTIDGNGATIQRDPAAGSCFRILYVSRLGNVSLKNMTLKNGCVNVTDAAGVHGAGGAIFNRGTLTLDGVTITNNFALKSGGAIHNDGTLTLMRTTVSNNSVTGSFSEFPGAGGGIVNRGAMQVFQSTISNNSTAGAGGAVDAGVVAAGGAGDGAGKATFANTTVSGNVSIGSGGGMFFSAAPLATVVNSTVTNNSSNGLGGGGIWVNYGGTVTLTNSIVARQVKSTNCWFLNFGNMIGGGNNLDSDATCPTSTTVADPMIGSLANNGGPTQTHALLFGSPAIGTANNAIATAFPVSSVDQRGVTRPQGVSSDIGAFELVPVATTTSVATSGTPSAWGASVTFTATVTSGGATGSVSFYDGATLLGSGPLSGTSATFTTSALGVGAHSITAVYVGDANYATSTSAAITQTVNPLPTTTTVATSGSPSTFGTSITFTATVTGGATGSISFYDGATLLGAGTIGGTTATFTISTLSVGGHSISAVYGGEGNYGGSTSPAITQTVDQIVTTTTVATSGSPSTFGSSVTFTATVTSGATGNVTFKDGVTSLGTGTLSGNTATFTTSALTAGDHSITAVYDGDTNDASSTSPAITQTVNPASDGVTLGSSLNPSNYGDAVTFTASVTIDATGSITFMDGAATLGSGTIGIGSATFTTSSLGGGSHDITAVYAGDANHSAATSPILTQVVNRATTAATITSSGSPYLVGHAVTFTATLPAGATGTVTFSDGATVLGTATLVNGTATFTTSALNAGPHSITASYGGDANFAPSVSAAAAILVATDPSIPTLSLWMLIALATFLIVAAAMKVGR